jgi:hypothetical protein
MLWLEASDFPAMRARSEREYLSKQVCAALASMGVLNRQGEARRQLFEYRQLQATQVMLARELGLTPAARMAIKATGSHAALDLPR